MTHVTTEGAVEDVEDVEVVDAVVVSPSQPLARRTTGQAVAQAAAVAVTGFAAGAATAALVRGHRRRKAVRPRPNRGGARMPEIVASRSFLVEVHLLGE